MKFMNGMEAARQIRRWDQRVALIFLTASREFAVEGYSVGASGYLLKPVEQETFEEALNRSLQNAIPGCVGAFWWSTEAQADELPMMISCILKAGG